MKKGLRVDRKQLQVTETNVVVTQAVVMHDVNTTCKPTRNLLLLRWAPFLLETLTLFLSFVDANARAGVILKEKCTEPTGSYRRDDDDDCEDEDDDARAPAGDATADVLFGEASFTSLARDRFRPLAWDASGASSTPRSAVCRFSSSVCIQG